MFIPPQTAPNAVAKLSYLPLGMSYKQSLPDAQEIDNAWHADHPEWRDLPYWRRESRKYRAMLHATILSYRALRAEPRYAAYADHHDAAFRKDLRLVISWIRSCIREGRSHA